MKPVLAPTTDVNSETALITAWFADDRAEVRKDDAVVEIETSKAIVEVVAPDDGLILHCAPVGAQIRLDDPIAFVFDDLESLERYVAEAAAIHETASQNGHGVRASDPARRRALELGVDLESLNISGLITVKHVEDAAAATGSGETLPRPLEAPAGTERVLLIGAGQGAQQVMEIFAARGDRVAVGIVDDDATRWGATVDDVPVVGGASELEALFGEGTFDSAIVAISTSIPARRKFRELLGRLGIPMTNAIDPTARLARDVRMGTGNVICAFCHVGAGSVIGDNNFVSAYNSFDHHNVLGCDSSTGPGCMTSGDVRLGDGVRLGTGIFVEPHVVLEDDVRVASGAIITSSVPAGHTVKTKVVTTAVVPPRVPVG